MPYNPQAVDYPRADRGFDVGLRDMITHLPEHLVMAEIGLFSGASTTIFLASGKVDKLYAVDSWRDYAEDAVPYWTPFTWQDVRDTFMAGPGQRAEVTVLAMPSLEGAAQIADGTLDFVYIDANHAYDYIKADLTAWLPKVRTNGWLGGHDYWPRSPGVVRAVTELGLGAPLTFSDSSWLLRLPEGAP